MCYAIKNQDRTLYHSIATHCKLRVWKQKGSKWYWTMKQDRTLWQSPTHNDLMLPQACCMWKINFLVLIKIYKPIAPNTTVAHAGHLMFCLFVNPYCVFCSTCTEICFFDNWVLMHS